MGFFKHRRWRKELDPDEIFLDSSNLPSFNTQQFEGRLEQPIAKWSIYFLGGCFLLVALLFVWQIGTLQLARGAAFAERSANNHLRYTSIFPERGVIYDRNNVELAWNDPEAGRVYHTDSGLAHILGYLGYPTEKELAAAPNKYDPKELIGKDGVEQALEEIIAGRKGIRIEEVDVSGAVTSDYLLHEPVNGDSVHLAIDSRLQTKLYEYIKNLANDRGFSGGAAVIMDVQTGELRALTSFPEYDSNIMTTRTDATKIKGFFNDKRQPFLDRAVSGLYTPGSIFKPFVAIGALEEEIIDPAKQILSTGSISIPNPYDPTKKTVFRDWKAHGWVDMRAALAVSSDVYFYEVGGGYPGQKGLGIRKIDEYAKLFGLAQKTGVELTGEAEGVIPTPEWKERVFDGEPWRIGDTYHTAIGQYGFQVTPIQMVRATAALANGGRLIKPTILSVKEPGEVAGTKLALEPQHLKIVAEGMRQAVVSGTAKGLSMPAVSIAAKTGTAELGVAKDKVNSWVVGYFPYEAPRYAFVVVMERGPVQNTTGGVFVMRQLLDWIAIYAPEYFKN